jgi:hypothetical protein
MSVKRRASFVAGWCVALVAASTVARAGEAPAREPAPAPAPALERAPAPTPATPASRPVTASAPTSAPVDSSTPKGTLKMLTKALDAGDRKVLLELFAAETPAEQKVADATASLAEATAVLRRASAKAFGEAASKPLGVSSDAVAEAFARVDASTETIEGTRATVSSPEDRGESLVLVLKDAKWRVPMSQIAGPAQGAELEQNLKDSAEQAKVFNAIADEVAAGKFKTAIDARQELDRRIMKLAMPATAPASAPAATAPAKR